MSSPDGFNYWSREDFPLYPPHPYSDPRYQQQPPQPWDPATLQRAVEEAVQRAMAEVVPLLIQELRHPADIADGADNHRDSQNQTPQDSSRSANTHISAVPGEQSSMHTRA